MTPLTCAKVSGLIARRNVGLSVSERLLAESHLSSCASCRETSKVVEGVRRANASSEDGVLTALSREQALKRAFEAAEGPPVSAARTTFQPRWALAGAAAVLAAVALSWLLAAPATPAASGDRVEAGQLASERGTLATGAAVPSELALESGAEEARLHVGSAEVRLAARSSITWRSQRDTLELGGGAVDVTVEHRPQRKFWVTTPRFRVEVVGTEFHVDSSSVRVSHGVVRVLSLGGDVLAVLPAGGAWSAPSALPAASGVEPTPAASANEPPAELDGAEAEKGRVTSIEPVAQRLASARRALGAGQIAEAEKLSEGVLAGRASAREAAEARTLLADCAVARGQTQRAALLYLGVAKAFPSLPAGENALFAGARLTERVSGKAQAQPLFAQYLQRYPRGRFRQEAERHLDTSTPR